MHSSHAPSLMSRDDRNAVFAAAAAASDNPSLPAAAALIPSRDHDPFVAPHIPHNVDFNARIAPPPSSASVPYPPLPNLSRGFPPPPPPAQHALPGPVEMAQIQHQSSNGNSFPDLSNLILTHPFLSVLFKKTFEICGAAAPFDNPQLSPYLDDCERSARELGNMASTHGLDKACSKYSSTDVYMVALLNAFNTLHVTMQSGASLQNPNLENTVLFAGKTIAGHTWNGSSRAGPMPANGSRGGFMQGDTLMHQVGPHLGPTRTPLTEQAKALLDKWFSDNFLNPFPTVQQKLELSNQCGMSLSSVNNWFGNKRMRIKRKMSLLPPPTDLSADAANMSDRVLAPRSKWHAIVISRMNTPQGREIIHNATGRGNQHGNGYYADEVHASSGVRSGDPPITTVGPHDSRFNQPLAGGRGVDGYQ